MRRQEKTFLKIVPQVSQKAESQTLDVAQGDDDERVPDPDLHPISEQCYRPPRSLPEGNKWDNARVPLFQVQTGRHRARSHERWHSMKVLCLALMLCGILIILELFGGIYGKSLALLTDVVHLLTDVGALLVALLSLYLAGRRSTRRYTYGWHRAEVIGALFSVLIIWVLVGAVGGKSIQHFYHFFKCRRILRHLSPFLSPQVPNESKALSFFPQRLSSFPNQSEFFFLDSYCKRIDGRVMMTLGFLGLLVNLTIALILRGQPNSHSDTPTAFNVLSSSASKNEDRNSKSRRGSHREIEELNSKLPFVLVVNAYSTQEDARSLQTFTPPTEHSNVNLRGAFLHALSDCLQSLGVILAGFCIWLGGKSSYSKFNIADPLASLLFAGIGLYTTRYLFHDLWFILMESCPKFIDYDAIYRDLLHIHQVKAVLDLHLWSLKMNYSCATAHLQVDDTAGDKNDTLAQVTKSAHKIFVQYKIDHSTIQIHVMEKFENSTNSAESR